MVTETKEDAEKAADEFKSQAKSKATTNQRGQVSTTSINDFRNQSSAVKDYTFIYQVRQNKKKKSIKTRSAPIVGRTERKIEDLGVQQCYKFDVSPGALILRYDGVVLKHPRWTRYNQDREDFAYN